MTCAVAERAAGGELLPHFLFAKQGAQHGHGLKHHELDAALAVAQRKHERSRHGVQIQLACFKRRQAENGNIDELLAHTPARVAHAGQQHTQDGLWCEGVHELVEQLGCALPHHNARIAQQRNNRVQQRFEMTPQWPPNLRDNVRQHLWIRKREEKRTRGEPFASVCICLSLQIVLSIYLYVCLVLSLCLSIARCTKSLSS